MWSGFGELVLVMEQDPGCSIDNLYGECESWFLEMIGAELSKEWMDVDQKKYMKLVEEEEARFFFWEWQKLSFDSSS